MRELQEERRPQIQARGIIPTAVWAFTSSRSCDVLLVSHQSSWSSATVRCSPTRHDLVAWALPRPPMGSAADAVGKHGVKAETGVIVPLRR